MADKTIYSTQSMYDDLKKLVSITGLTPSTVKRIQLAYKLGKITKEQYDELMGLTK